MGDVPGPGIPLTSHKSEVRRRLGISRRNRGKQLPAVQIQPVALAAV